MGGLFSVCGVERLIDPSVSVIDLRSHTKTDRWSNYNPVYIMLADNKRYLFVDYFGVIYNLGPVINMHPIDSSNANESVITMQNGRRYIVYTYLNEYDYDNRNFIDVNKHLRKSY